MLKKNIKKKLFLFLYIILIFIFFFIFEIFLRLINYGINTDPFIEKHNYYISNKFFINKYYNTSLNKFISYPKNIFHKNKGNKLRGFVIGGSTAEGFPYLSNHSFSKITEIFFNKNNIELEILNLGFSAMSSYYVADVSKKILKYKPDFLIIYSGHNEYYGTISISTGGNYITKKIFLFFKEFKIFQLIDNLIRLNKKNIINKNLMESQFNDKIFEKNDKTDKEVANNFIKNIDYVVKLYNKYKIPVIIIEPISNLIDMPPFKSNFFNNDIDINLYKLLIDKKDKEGIKKFYNDNNNLLNKYFDYYSSIIYYLDSLKKFYIDNEIDLNKFIIAKDYDIIPFRARNNITESLLNYYNSNKNKYQNLFIIPLFELLNKNYGASVFSNIIFSDHLHFNRNGNIIVSKFIVYKLIEVFNFKIEKYNVEYFFNNKELIDKENFFLPFHNIISYYMIDDLLNNYPFKNMLIKYKQNFIEKNELSNNYDLLYQLKDNKDDSYNIILNYYKNIDETKYLLYLESYRYLFPASDIPYLYFINYFLNKNDIENAKFSFLKAYILSDRNLYNDLKKFYLKNNFNIKNLKNDLKKINF